MGLDLGDGPGRPGTGGAALDGARTPPCLPGILGAPPPPGGAGGADLMEPGRLRVGDGDGGLLKRINGSKTSTLITTSTVPMVFQINFQQFGCKVQSFMSES